MGLKVIAKSQVSPADMTPGGSKLSEKKKMEEKEKNWVHQQQHFLDYCCA